MNVPNNSVTFPIARVSGGCLHVSTTGTNADRVTFDNAVLGSMFCVPLRIPMDLDQTYPSYVYADLQATVDNATTGLTAVLQANATMCPENGAWFDWDGQVDFAIPNPWSFLDTTRVSFDNGGGNMFPGGTLIPGGMLGMRLRRLPANPNDNYPQLLGALASLTLVYHQRCQWPLCC